MGIAGRRIRAQAGRCCRYILAGVSTTLLSGCSEVLGPVQSLGDALRGLFESLPF